MSSKKLLFFKQNGFFLKWVPSLTHQTYTTPQQYDDVHHIPRHRTLRADPSIRRDPIPSVRPSVRHVCRNEWPAFKRVAFGSRSLSAFHATSCCVRRQDCKEIRLVERATTCLFVAKSPTSESSVGCTYVLAVFSVRCEAAHCYVVSCRLPIRRSTSC